MIVRLNKKQLIAVQLVFWLIVCTLSFYPIDWHRPGFPPHHVLREHHPLGPHPGNHFHGPIDIVLFLVQNLSIIFTFYFNYFVLIPAFFSKGKIKQYILSALGFIVAITLLPLLFAGFSSHFHLHLNPRNFHQTVISLLAVCLAILIPLAFKISTDHAEADREKTKAELSFLRSQINHHFLFNSLNNIYSLSIQGNKHTSEAIYSLSSIMRHMVSASASGKIPLQQEINFIHHYIEIQKLRLSENTSLQYDIHGQSDGKLISPMLLIPFVENCFKHGVSTSQPSHIEIQLNIHDSYLELSTKNNIIPHIQNTDIKSGVGLNNVRKRLDYEYPSHYNMQQEIKEGSYFSYLKIDLI